MFLNYIQRSVRDWPFLGRPRLFLKEPLNDRNQYQSAQNSSSCIPCYVYQILTRGQAVIRYNISPFQFFNRLSSLQLLQIRPFRQLPLICSSSYWDLSTAAQLSSLPDTSVNSLNYTSDFISFRKYYNIYWSREWEG